MHTERQELWRSTHLLTEDKKDLARMVLDEIRRGRDVTRTLRSHPLRGGGYLNKSMLVTIYNEMVATGEIREDARLLERIRMKPMRTLSGVTTVTALTKPYPCPGKCIFCPTDVRMPKSYLPDEPGAMRGLEHEFDPYGQVRSRIEQLESVGHPTDKIELLKQSFAQMVPQLRPQDRVAIVTYAGSAGLVLPSTPGSEQDTILAALERLSAGGSTNGGAGIELAYATAQQHFIQNGVNRVILATDGDFNVGITDVSELKGFVERKRAGGIYLSVLGFGRGNYNDELMQALAQNGNGTAAYIDTLNEARRVLVDEASSTLFPIAEDVKLQVELNPAMVSEYRLIGYETRLLAREDFNNDKVDAGEIGSGHSVTAIYEIAPAGSGAELVDPLRYGGTQASRPGGGSGEYAFLKMRYKLPGEAASRLIETPVGPEVESSLEAAPREARFAAESTFGFVQDVGRRVSRTDWVKNFAYPAPRTFTYSEIVTPEAGYVLGVDSNARNAQNQNMTPPAHSMSGYRLATAHREGRRGAIGSLLRAMQANPDRVQPAAAIGSQPAVSFDGYIVAEHTEVGQWVSKGEPIVELVELDRIDITGVAGGRARVPVHAGRIEIAGASLLARLVACEDEVIIGRDVLNRLVVHLDGPRLRLRLS